MTISVEEETRIKDEARRRALETVDRINSLAAANDIYHPGWRDEVADFKKQRTVNIWERLSAEGMAKAEHRIAEDRRRRDLALEKATALVLPTVDGEDLIWSSKIEGAKGEQVTVLSAFILGFSESWGRSWGFHHWANPDKPNFAERIINRIDITYSFSFLRRTEFLQTGTAKHEWITHHFRLRINPGVTS